MSENNEEFDDYAAQDLEIMNTKEATAYFWFRPGVKAGEPLFLCVSFSQIFKKSLCQISMTSVRAATFLE